ncbi:hypothetical protein [Deinococcus hopiensis]|uniref:Uncharacterized protein n=1 Tax=Deinococcus hopiensis KR-140 TaxID=695939 RepID=A0A1W1UE92_9DEIO|nr:hypothetical protein [Deinococcus hopiensis]SMB79359.1 hypothetical protein SAMN00790413_05898 [Deinococcus hopiensis KR-140]
MDLLVTVALLNEMPSREKLTLDTAVLETLRSELEALLTRPPGAPAAQEAHGGLLTPGEREQLTQARGECARRAELLAARARFAGPQPHPDAVRL